MIVEVLEPSSGRVYDPCCGSGGMFVQTEKFIYEHDGDPKDVSIYGQESIEETWRMAKMNLAIHGIDNKGLGARWSDTFARDQHPDVQMDYVMANPPFNIKDWARNEEDPRWRFGVPPANNANYAWIQHILYKLAPGGRAGVVMANGSMSSNSNGEGIFARRSWRRIWFPAWSRYPPSCSAAPESRCACGFSPKTRRQVSKGLSTGAGRCCSSTLVNWAT